MSESGEFPLSAAVEGDVVILAGFMNGGRQALRLAELGLTAGTRVRVLQASPGQPILIQVRGARLAVDRETAAHMRVVMHHPAPCRHRRGGAGRGRRGARHWGRGPRGLGRGWHRRLFEGSQSVDQEEHDDA